MVFYFKVKRHKGTIINGDSKGFQGNVDERKTKKKGELIPLSLLFHIFAMKIPRDPFKREKVMTEDIDLIRITGVEYVKDYTMRLEFSNGKVKLVDFLPLLKGILFEPLKDLRNFVQFGLTHWTLEWYNGADFAPDYLYRNGVEA